MVWIFLQCLENYQKYSNNLGNIFRKFSETTDNLQPVVFLATHNVTATLGMRCNLELDKIVYGMYTVNIPLV